MRWFTSVLHSIPTNRTKTLFSVPPQLPGPALRKLVLLWNTLQKSKVYIAPLKNRLWNCLQSEYGDRTTRCYSHTISEISRMQVSVECQQEGCAHQDTKLIHDKLDLGKPVKNPRSFRNMSTSIKRQTLLFTGILDMYMLLDTWVFRMSRNSRFRAWQQKKKLTACDNWSSCGTSYQNLSAVGISESWLVTGQFPCRKMLWSCQKRSCKLGYSQSLDTNGSVDSDATRRPYSPSAGTAGQLMIASEQCLNIIHLEKIQKIPARQISKGFFSNTLLFCTFKNLHLYKWKVLLFILTEFRPQTRAIPPGCARSRQEILETVPTEQVCSPKFSWLHEM